MPTTAIGLRIVKEMTQVYAIIMLRVCVCVCVCVFIYFIQCGMNTTPPDSDTHIIIIIIIIIMTSSAWHRNYTNITSYSTFKYTIFLSCRRQKRYFKATLV